jgi:hypothetical protein
VGTNIAFEAVLVHFMMLKSLRSMEIAIAMTAAKPFNIAVR